MTDGGIMEHYLVIALMISVGFNAYQLFKSITQDEREKYIKNLEKEISKLRLSNQTAKANEPSLASAFKVKDGDIVRPDDE